MWCDKRILNESWHIFSLTCQFSSWINHPVSVVTDGSDLCLYCTLFVHFHLLYSRFYSHFHTFSALWDLWEILHPSPKRERERSESIHSCKLIWLCCSKTESCKWISYGLSAEHKTCTWVWGWRRRGHFERRNTHLLRCFFSCFCLPPKLGPFLPISSQGLFGRYAWRPHRRLQGKQSSCSLMCRKDHGLLLPLWPHVKVATTTQMPPMSRDGRVCECWFSRFLISPNLKFSSLYLCSNLQVPLHPYENIHQLSSVNNHILHAVLTNVHIFASHFPEHNAFCMLF